MRSIVPVIRSQTGSAQEFIAKVASVSSTTGQPYRIRFPDGHEMLSGDYLRTVLQQLEQPSRP
jgi:Family of unknown function (DUF5329)